MNHFTNSNRAWRHADVEPDLEEMLDDPVIQTVMRYDRIGKADVIEIVRMARTRLCCREGDAGRVLTRVFSSENRKTDVI